VTAKGTEIGTGVIVEVVVVVVIVSLEGKEAMTALLVEDVVIGLAIAPMHKGAAMEVVEDPVTNVASADTLLVIAGVRVVVADTDRHAAAVAGVEAVARVEAEAGVGPPGAGVAAPPAEIVAAAAAAIRKIAHLPLLTKEALPNLL